MNQVKSQRLIIYIWLFLALAACQSSERPIDRDNLETASAELLGCLAMADQFRKIVDSEGVRNASALALASVPMFHSNRFLDLLAKEAATESQTRQWFSQSATLAAAVRGSENQNLEHPWSDSRLDRLNLCAENFANHDEHINSRRQTLQQLPLIPDNYSSLPQWLGFNWLLRPIFKSRIELLHEEEKRLFDQTRPFDVSFSYKPKGTSHQKDSEIAQWFVDAYDANPLKTPMLTDTQLSSLIALHRPRFTIEFKDDNDLIGQPVWQDEELAISLDKPTVYTLPSLTRFGTNNLLQLNYVVWFSERKPTSSLDLYAGNIDGLIWRVTLDEQGKVLLYDSIHSCGCYHKYFIATDEVSTRKLSLSEEPANIFTLANINTKAGVHIRLTANEHYVVGVSDSDSELVNAKPYSTASYNELSNLNYQGRSKSLFSGSGIIIDSKRIERFTLWPTGIDSVGAMRQWGSHATGFVEQQHFDDATLLNHYFLRLNSRR
jgi:hypothetical protein